jgi:hypothetical protein
MILPLSVEAAAGNMKYPARHVTLSHEQNPWFTGSGQALILLSQ